MFYSTNELIITEESVSDSTGGSLFFKGIMVQFFLIISGMKNV